MIRTADLLGYAIALDRCADCRRRPAGAGMQEAWLEYRLGGLLCTDCAAGTHFSGERVPGEVVRALRAAAARPPRVAAAHTAAAAVRTVDRLLSFHQDRHLLNSEKLLEFQTPV